MPLRYEEQIDLPHEPGEWIKVVQPGVVTLRRAREVKAAEQIRWYREAKDIFDQAAQAQQNTPQPAEAPPAAPAAAPDPFANQFDLLTLLQGCIVAWSYPEPVTDEHIGWLSEKTARYIGERLVPRADESDQKNA